MVNTDTEIIKLIEEAARNKVETLDLTFKRLTSLPPEIGQLKNHLKFLDLRNNKLKTLPPEIGKLQSLNALFLTTNYLEELPPEIGNLSTLHRLSLTENKLSHLPQEFGNLIGLTELYLANNQLNSLPTEFGRLINLERLSLSNNQLTLLPEEFGNLKKLSWLDLKSNKLESLNPEIRDLKQLSKLNISYNQLTNLPPQISEVESLIELNASYNQLTSLPGELGELSNLDLLNLSHNKIEKLPREIGQLKNLNTLNLIYNNLYYLPSEIGELSQLIDLRLSHNYLDNIPSEIEKLRKLTTLYLGYNKLKILPTGIIQLVRFGQLTILDLKENLLSIPPEIIWSKNDPNKIIDFYEKQQLNHEKQHLNEAKILLVGQGAVGKTSLIRRLIYGQFDIQQPKTHGINIKSWYLNINNNQDVKLNVWDFGGQEIYHATHQFFLTQRSLYLLVLNSRLDERDNQLEYWLQIIQSYGNSSPIIIVINRIDEHFLDLDRRGLRNKYPNIKAFVETSCKTGYGMDELQETIAYEVSQLSHIYDELPRNWLIIKAELEKKKEQNWDYISYEEYQEMCKQYDIITQEEQKALISFLHNLGVALNFQDDPRLKDTNILNPLWVTNGVYKILDDKALENHYKGILIPGMLERILDDAKYPRHKHMFILEMMRKFELCFQLEKAGEPEFLIADLLPKEEPENLNQWEKGLAFEYHYSVLPSSILSRFIVRMSQLIYNNLYWRNGVVLKDEDNLALIKADRYSNKIFIWVSGLEETRRDLLKAIRIDFQQIHQNVPGIEVTEKIVIPNHSEIVVDYQYLLDLEQMEITHFVPVGLKAQINVKELLEGFISEQERSQKSEVFPIKSPIYEPVNTPKKTKVKTYKSVFLNPLVVYNISFLITFSILIIFSKSLPIYLLVIIILLGLILMITIVILKDNQNNKKLIQSTLKKKQK